MTQPGRGESERLPDTGFVWAQRFDEAAKERMLTAAAVPGSAPLPPDLPRTA